MIASDVLFTSVYFKKFAQITNNSLGIIFLGIILSEIRLLKLL